MTEDLLFPLPEPVKRKNTPRESRDQRVTLPKAMQPELELKTENVELVEPSNNFASLRKFAEYYGITNFLKLDRFRQDADQQEFLEFYFKKKTKDL